MNLTVGGWRTPELQMPHSLAHTHRRSRYLSAEIWKNRHSKHSVVPPSGEKVEAETVNMQFTIVYYDHSSNIHAAHFIFWCFWWFMSICYNSSYLLHRIARLRSFGSLLHVTRKCKIWSCQCKGAKVKRGCVCTNQWESSCVCHTKKFLTTKTGSQVVAHHTFVPTGL